MSAQPPWYSVSTWSTPHNSIREDVAQISRTGAQGIGLWEGKFEAAGDERIVRGMLQEQGLRVTSCAPRIWTIFPVPWASPTVPALDFSRVEQDPRARVRLICEGLPRLAALAPQCILIGTGASVGVSTPAALDVISEGVGEIADAAARLGLRVGVELTSARRGAPIWRLGHMLALLDALGRPNVGVILDVFHSAMESGVETEILEHTDRIVGVHVNDVPWQERGLYDRALPGEGRGLAPKFIAALLRGGYCGWYELEIVSDDGTFGTALPDSLWAIPHEELLRRGKAAFDRAYRRAVELAGCGDDPPGQADR